MLNLTELYDPDLQLLVDYIYERYQSDFRNYAHPSLSRRINRALVELNVRNVNELYQKLQKDEKFYPKLLSILTINTTEMFRDPEYFKFLKEEVFPYLKTFPSIKIWVAGCSTGEEVLSLAILLRESGFKRYLLYASDINPKNLSRARMGIYETNSIKRASANYFKAGGSKSLSDYYQSAYDSVQFDPSLLENVVFTDHSLATDSVFSEMHLISCRNVLIYFQKVLQDRALKLFDSSLIRGGFLTLGSKETMQFTSLEREYVQMNFSMRIYQKKARFE